MQENDQVGLLTQYQLAHVVKEQIEAPVKCLLTDGHTISAAKLLLSGIDLMGYLTLPDGRHKVESREFKKWTENYMDLVKSGQLCSEEIWQTRCDLLHAHGYRDHAENKQVRYVVFCGLSEPPAYREGEKIDLVRVPINEFLSDFLFGANQFVIDLYSKRDRAIRTQTRLEHVQYVRSRYLIWGGKRLRWGGKLLTWTGGLSHLRQLPDED